MFPAQTLYKQFFGIYLEFGFFASYEESQCSDFFLIVQRLKPKDERQLTANEKKFFYSVLSVHRLIANKLDKLRDNLQKLKATRR